MTVRDALRTIGPRLGRVGWLAALALPLILAACNPGGTSTY
jgi:hypothetical protein